MVFLNIALIVRWFCTLPRGQIDSFWFDHQRQWTLLMVLIKPEKYAGQNHVHIWCETLYIDGLMQERCNSIANALELRLSCTDPSTCSTCIYKLVISDKPVHVYLSFAPCDWYLGGGIYCDISNISYTKCPNFNDSHLVLQLSLPNPLKPDVKLRMKMQLEQCRQALLQLHLSDQQFYWPLRCTLY